MFFTCKYPHADDRLTWLELRDLCHALGFPLVFEMHSAAIGVPDQALHLTLSGTQ